MKRKFIGISRHRLLTDGPGITTLVCFSGCPLRCKYCPNKSCWNGENAVEYSPQELINVVSKDSLYFIATGGGIMFGGGEPLLQSKFIKRFKLLCDKRWHLYVETSLNVPKKHIHELIPIIDEFIVDIKDINNDIYKAYTGGIDNTNVVENLRVLIQCGCSNKITVRVPLIPDYNTKEDIKNSVSILKNIGISNFEYLTYLRPEELRRKHSAVNKGNSYRMNYGKAVCEVLKKVRMEIAYANNLCYSPHFCPHKQCATGTCPLCESDLKNIEQKLMSKASEGYKINL